MFFSLHILLEMKENHPKYYMDNFEAIVISSSIKLAIEGVIPTLFFSLKAMVIATCNASKSNQCPWD
jgi:hypothetical protein